MGKAADGLRCQRQRGGDLIWNWRIGREKSKDFHDKKQCAIDFVTKYVERYPKYKEMLYDKTWDEILRIFTIHL